MPGSFRYSPAAGTVLAVGTQQLTAVFSPTDATDYSSILISPRKTLIPGAGSKTDAKPGDNAQEVPAFNYIHDNQVVGTVNYGIQFAAGHDNVAANDRVISSGLLADGTRIAAQHVGMANAGAGGAADLQHQHVLATAITTTTVHRLDVLASLMLTEGYRKDQYFPASPADYSTNSVLAAGQITLAMENNEYQVWVNKMATAGIAVGPSF